MLDLSPFTFVPELTREALYNESPLEHGAVFASEQQGGTDGRARAAGSADRAVAYVRESEEAVRNAPPKVRDTVTVKDGRDYIDYTVVSVLETRAGAVKLLLERRGSRRIETGRR